MSYIVGIGVHAAQNRDAWQCFVNMAMNEVYLSSEKRLRAVC